MFKGSLQLLTRTKSKMKILFYEFYYKIDSFQIHFRFKMENLTFIVLIHNSQVSFLSIQHIHL